MRAGQGAICGTHQALLIIADERLRSSFWEESSTNNQYETHVEVTDCILPVVVDDIGALGKAIVSLVATEYTEDA